MAAIAALLLGLRRGSHRARGARPSLESLEARALPAPVGSLDTSFGRAGVVQFDAGALNFASTRITQLAVQDDGAILAGGFVTPVGGPEALAVFRFNPDGSPDSSFGNRGVAILALAGVDAHLANGTDPRAQSVYVAFESDTGDVVMAGNLFTPNQDASLGQHFIVARFRGDGSLDEHFNSGQGYLIGPVNSSATGLAIEPGTSIGVVNATGGVATGVATAAPARVSLSSDNVVTPGGSTMTPRPPRGIIRTSDLIYVSGHSGNSDFALYRINADGALDASFGSSGVVTTTPPADMLPGGSSQLAVSARDVAVNGRVLVAGIYGNPQGAAGTPSGSIVARYDADGYLDTTFGTNGLVTVAGASLTRTAVEPDQSILLTGSVPDSSNPGRSNLFVMHLNNDGSTDATFGSGGMVTTAVGDGSSAGVNILFLNGFVSPGFIGPPVPLLADAVAKAPGAPSGLIAPLRTGEIIVSAASLPATGQEHALALVAFHADGSLDTTFGNKGMAPLDDGTGAAFPGLASSWGDIYVGGYRTNADGTSAAVLEAFTGPPPAIVPLYALGVSSNSARSAAVTHMPLFLRLSGNGPFSFRGANRIWIADPVNSHARVRVILHVTHGTLTVKKSRGVLVTGNGRATLSLTGTQPLINRLLSSLSYRPRGYHGRVMLSVTNTVLGRPGARSTGVLSIFVGLPKARA